MADIDEEACMSSFDGDAAGDAAISNRRRRSRLFISDLCQPALVALIIIVLPWYFALSDLPADFSVRLEPTTTTTGHIIPGLITTTTNTSSSSSPVTAAAANASAFHGTLHAGNRRATERCYGHGDAAVTYGGFTVASGRVPGFCVPAKRRREVPFQLDAGVGVSLLTEHLRGRAADEAAMVGALELEVQIELFHHGGGGGGTASAGGTPSRRMWCTARVGSTAQPPEVAMCTVFAVQNWFDFGA